MKATIILQDKTKLELDWEDVVETSNGIKKVKELSVIYDKINNVKIMVMMSTTNTYK